MPPTYPPKSRACIAVLALPCLALLSACSSNRTDRLEGQVAALQSQVFALCRQNVATAQMAALAEAKLRGIDIKVGSHHVALIAEEGFPVPTHAQRDQAKIDPAYFEDPCPAFIGNRGEARASSPARTTARSAQTGYKPIRHFKDGPRVARHRYP